MNRYKGITILFLWLSIIISSCTDTITTADATTEQQAIKHNRATVKKKVLLIGIDGVQYRNLQNTHTPNLDKLHYQKAYTGGVIGQPTEQKTKSGPGWMSILTGTWLNQHGVSSNNATALQPRVASIFSYIRQAIPTAYIASVVSWAPIHSFLEKELSLLNHASSHTTDDLTVEHALKQLQQKDPDFLFVHLDATDVIGHQSGTASLAYQKAIEKADTQVGVLLDAVANRIKNNQEDWLVLVTTDHGRSPVSGYGHGGQSESEKTIFIASNKTLYTSPKIQQQSSLGVSKVYQYKSQVSIVPTILSFLDIAMGVDTVFPGRDLLSSTSALQLRFSKTSAHTLRWSSTSISNATIYKNGISIGSVPANQGVFTDTDPATKAHYYTVAINGQYVSIFALASQPKITAALDWGDSTNRVCYMFKSDATYVKYDKLQDKAYAGYPVKTSSYNWPGLAAYKDKIQAAFNKDNKTAYVFLSDGRYIRYNMILDKADAGYPKPINDSTWPALQEYRQDISATLNWDNRHVYFFLKTGYVISYDLLQDKVVLGYPKAIAQSVFFDLVAYKDKIQAAIDWRGTYCYFFLKDNTYLKYHKKEHRVLSGYPRAVSSTSWPGL